MITGAGMHSDDAPALGVAARTPHAAPVRRLAVVHRDLFTRLDGAPGVHLDPVADDPKEGIRPAGVVQKTENIPLCTVQRTGVAQVDEAYPARVPRAFSCLAKRDKVAGDLADLGAARNPHGREHAFSFDCTGP